MINIDSLRCVVERITYRNEDNGYTVIKVRAKGYSELVTVVGNMLSINIGVVLTISGDWKIDRKYGRQFNIINYEETLPASIVGIQKYLASGLIKNVGSVYAKKIVDLFKETTLDVIETEPDRLIEVTGIGKKRVEAIKKAWLEQKEIKNIMLFFTNS